MSLPSVLQYPIIRQGKPDMEAISVERALKNALEVIENGPITIKNDDAHYTDAALAAMDDLRTMIKAVGKA